MAVDFVVVTGADEVLGVVDDDDDDDGGGGGGDGQVA